MPEQVTAYKVFIASPGGLEAEREAFRSALSEHNDNHALFKDCMFLPVGWETMPSGVGRPQELINIELRKCDYFVLMLWDRWGSPSDKMPGSKFSSGTEEEYYEAIKCLDDDSLPMQRIVVLFKSVDSGKLGDPGPKLQPVLDFKKELEAQHAVLFSTFDEVRRFEQLMRQHLALWVRDHESGGVEVEGLVTKPAPPTISEVTIEDPDSLVAEPAVAAVLERAGKLERDGQVTEAEEEFANALAGRESGQILLNYGKLLTRAGRFSDADRALRRGLRATGEDDLRWRVFLLNELSFVADLRGQYQEGLLLDREALDLDPGDSVLTLNLGIGLRKVGSYEAARLLLEEYLSRSAKDGGPNKSEVVDVEFVLGTVALAQGRFKEARGQIEAASVPGHRPRGLTRPSILSVAGNLYLAMDEVELAETSYNQAAEAIGEKPAGDDYLVRDYIDRGLAEIALRRGDLDGAERGFLTALEFAESAFGPEHNSVAKCLGGLGRVYAAQQSFQLAEDSLLRAWRVLAVDLGPKHPEAVRPLLDLARVYRQQGQNDAAIRFYERALSVLKESIPDHPETKQAELELESLKKRVTKSSAAKARRKPAPSAKKAPRKPTPSAKKSPRKRTKKK